MLILHERSGPRSVSDLLTGGYFFHISFFVQQLFATFDFRPVVSEHRFPLHPTCRLGCKVDITAVEGTAEANNRETGKTSRLLSVVRGCVGAPPLTF